MSSIHTKRRGWAKLVLTLSTLGIILLAYLGFFQTNKQEIKRPEHEITLANIEDQFGYHISKHARQRMTQRNISPKELYNTLNKGKKYYDITKQSYAFHLLDTNVIVTNKTIVTLYRGKVKARWQEVHD